MNFLRIWMRSGICTDGMYTMCPINQNLKDGKLGFSGELKSSFVSNYSSVAYGATFPRKGRLITTIVLSIDGMFFNSEDSLNHRL